MGCGCFLVCGSVVGRLVGGWFVGLFWLVVGWLAGLVVPWLVGWLVGSCAVWADLCETRALRSISDLFICLVG